MTGQRDETLEEVRKRVVLAGPETRLSRLGALPVLTSHARGQPVLEITVFPTPPAAAANGSPSTFAVRTRRRTAAVITIQVFVREVLQVHATFFSMYCHAPQPSIGPIRRRSRALRDAR